MGFGPLLQGSLQGPVPHCVMEKQLTWSGPLKPGSSLHAERTYGVWFLTQGPDPEPQKAQFCPVISFNTILSLPNTLQMYRNSPQIIKHIPEISSITNGSLEFETRNHRSKLHLQIFKTPFSFTKFANLEKSLTLGTPRPSKGILN